MGLSVMRRLVMSLAFTLPAVVSIVRSTPPPVSSVLFISEGWTLSNNNFNFSEIPGGIGHLSRLQNLNLSYSALSGQIPSQLLALSKLAFLDLSGNEHLQLQKPDLRNMVESLPRLKKLHLSQVNISSAIPDSLSNLSSLTSLLLSECGLHGEFPISIFQLPRLESLQVSSNSDLRGYLPKFQESSPLKELNLINTRFSGELPSSIGNLSSLTTLGMRLCNFSGLVVASLGQLTQLTFLGLSYNSFSGQIPSSFANLTQLTNLYLSGNQLIGQIPSWLNNLTRLIELTLQNNKLEGAIPTSLFGLVNLERLYLYYNYLNGTVELNMLAKLKNLTELQLSFNSLSLLTNTPSNGTFPKFRLLALDSCNLTEFPDFLQNQDELEMLFLSYNKIHAPIPKWMWNISKETLEILTLNGNFLTGFDQLPAVLPWSRMINLDLSSNRLHGSLSIPPPSTISYSVFENKLTGEIPSLICKLTSLELLDLSTNNLSGRIPQCLSNLSNSLSVLNLRGNSFHGTIPQTCTEANNLRMIDLSDVIPQVQNIG